MIATEISTPASPAVWRPCPTCWGQRRVFEDRNGEGLVPHPCATCLGLGQELVTLGDPRARAFPPARPSPEEDE